MPSFPGPNIDHLFGPVSPSQAAKGLSWALNRLSAVGATVPTTARPSLALTVLRRTDESMPILRSTRNRRLLGESMKLAFEYYLVARAIQRPREGLPKRLHRALQLSYAGDLDPRARDEQSRRARDTQFELWLAAWLTAGGRPVQFLEPDIRVTCWFAWYGVAAKRVQSPKGILPRVKEAAAQIERHGDRGFVALTIDAMSPHFTPRFATLRTARSYFTRLPELREAVEWCHASAPCVRGLVTLGTLLRWRTATSPPHAQLSWPMRIDMLPNDDRDQERFASFWEETQSCFRRRVAGL